MTNDEFKAWFDGFCENLEGIPNEKQWQKIKSKVRDINGDRITYPIFVDRYWPNRYPATWLNNNFNSTKAMYELGKRESK